MLTHAGFCFHSFKENHSSKANIVFRDIQSERIDARFRQTRTQVAAAETGVINLLAEICCSRRRGKDNFAFGESVSAVGFWVERLY